MKRYHITLLIVSLVITFGLLWYTYYMFYLSTEKKSWERKEKNGFTKSSSENKKYNFSMKWFIYKIVSISFIISIFNYDVVYQPFFSFLWSTLSKVFEWLIVILIFVWYIVKRPLMVLWGLIVIYSIVKFIKRSWEN